MPSPFPGMDPHLEGRALWSGVHKWLMTYLAEALQPLLGARYVAEVGERVYVEASGRTVEPDVAILRAPSSAPGPSTQTMSPDAPAVVVLEEIEAREFFLEIVDLTAGNRVVTIIEVLSPSNKDPRSSGYRQYRAKQTEVLQSGTHLIEIDLLRGGEHTIAIPPLALKSSLPDHYLVSISRAEDRRRREFYAIRLPQKLPRIPVPLSAPDADAVVDLQAVLDKAYENGAYSRRIDYRVPPTPPLDAAEEAWRLALSARPQ